MDWHWGAYLVSKLESQIKCHRARMQSQPFGFSDCYHQVHLPQDVTVGPALFLLQSPLPPAPPPPGTGDFIQWHLSKWQGTFPPSPVPEEAPGPTSRALPRGSASLALPDLLWRSPPTTPLRSSICTVYGTCLG